MTFRKATHTRIIHDMVRQVQEAIMEGKFQVGEKLPSERELCDLFQASRGSLREALRVLEQKGLIMVKTGVGGGAFVQPVSSQKVSESLDLLLQLQGVTLGELAEFREVLEGIAAGLAAERSGPQEILQLKGLLDEAKAHLDEGPDRWDAFIRMDSRIHEAIARITGNRLYGSVLRSVYDNMHRYHDRFLPREEKVMKLMYRQLKGIVDSVETGEADLARHRAQEHVRSFNRIAEERQKKR